MTSKQVSDSNNQQINDLHRLIKKYHAIRNIVKILTVPINIKPQFTFQNLNCKKYDHEVSHHKKSVNTIHMVWKNLKLWRYENEYLRTQHINLKNDFFNIAERFSPEQDLPNSSKVVRIKSKLSKTSFPGIFCCGTWSKMPPTIPITRYKKDALSWIQIQIKNTCINTKTNTQTYMILFSWYLIL